MSHEGVAGNEKADNLAVVDHSHPLIYLKSKIPKSFIKSEARKHLLEIWQDLWSNSRKGRDTYSLVPIIGRCFWDVSSQIIQLLTGHGPFPAYLYRINKLDDPDCVCGEYGEGEHFLFPCGVYTSEFFRQPSLEKRMIWIQKLIKICGYSASMWKWLIGCRCIIRKGY